MNPTGQRRLSFHSLTHTERERPKLFSAVKAKASGDFSTAEATGTYCRFTGWFCQVASAPQPLWKVGTA